MSVSHKTNWSCLPAHWCGAWSILCALTMVGGFVGCQPGETSQSQPVYPTRPIKLIVPFSAGGGSDTFARIIKRAIEDNELLPQPLVIINLGGAGGTIGTRRTKDAKPDGDTMMLMHNALFTAQFSGVVPYGPESFTPIAATGEVGMVITAAENAPYGSLVELMTDARDRPDQVVFGANMGAMTHFAGLQLEAVAPGARFRFVQNGDGADRFADLKGGHVSVTGFSIEEFVRFRSAGLKALAYFGEVRHPAMPEVPTAREQGFDVVSANMYYWWFPRNTPAENVAVIADALERAMQTEYVQQKMAEIHCDPVFLRGPQLADKLKEETIKFAAIQPPRDVELPDFPNLLFGVTTLVVLAVLAEHFAGKIRRPNSADDTSRTCPAPIRRVALAAAVLAVTGLYVASMAGGWLPFRTATLLYVPVAGVLLATDSRRSLTAVMTTACVLAFGLDYLFTQVFVVDLP